MNLLYSTGDYQRSTGDHLSYPLPANATSEAQPDPANGKDCSATCCGSNEHTYLRPLRTSGARPPLICFFPGPPGARDLADSLPEDQPVYEIYWPNMDRETSFPTVEQLAALFVQDIRKLQAHGPYQFCGYSTFGLVAYEMGRLLLSQGEDVTFLALFDIWHPQFRQMLTRPEMARYRVLRIIDRLGKYGRILHQGGLNDAATRVLEFVVKTAKSIGWRATRIVFRIAGRPVPRAVQVIESIAANQAYVPPPYPKRFILIRTEDILERKLRDQTVGWHVCATEGVDVHFVRGDHGTIKDKPFVRGVVEKIAPYLAIAPKS
jgi:thioesterase domain-containing protein